MIKNKSPLRYPGGKTRACKILDELFLENFDKKIDAIIDGGISPIEIPSTIFDLTKMKILREGFIKEEDIKRVLSD